MSDTAENTPFADGFLEDFFAESEEHLTTIRRNLLALEAALPQGRPSPATLEELFRSFHSLKGISGMVEMEQAEVLAHDMEGYLRALRDGETVLSARGVEALIDGTRALDAVVAARREHRPPPDIQAVRGQLAAIVPERSASTAARQAPAAPAAPAEPPRAAAPPDAWRVTFVPSNELLARGVNVNVIRGRLQEVGTILDARPRVLAAGGIAFEFTVSLPSGAAALDAWRSDGVSYERAMAAEAGGGPSEETASAPTPAAAGINASASSSGGRLVRVDLARLDEVMRTLADIVVTRTRLDQQLDGVEDKLPHGDWRALQEANQALERQTRVLRDAVMRLRLVPVREIFGKMPFVVRDLARDTGKQVRLDLHGQDTEIDKFLIERMMDPIIHLVRNAISHGVEPADERVAAGKPPTATIGLRAATVGEQVVIEVEDDGRGIDREAVRARARTTGLEVPSGLDAAAMLDLLCTAGFSTRDEADRAAGRGVGMSVVRRAVEELSGTIDLDSEPGRGTRFVLTLPVTLAIIDALICRVGGRRFAVPQTAIREVLELQVGAVRVMERNELFRYRDATLPLVHVADLLRLERTATAGRMHVLVVGTGLQAVGLGVDRILGQREIVVRAAPDPLVRVEGLAGATELGDGQPLLILDPASLVRLARRSNGARDSAPGARNRAASTEQLR